MLDEVRSLTFEARLLFDQTRSFLLVKLRHQDLPASSSSDLLLRFHDPLEADAVEVFLSSSGQPKTSLKDCSILLVGGDLEHLSIGCWVGERQMKRGLDYEVSLSYRSLGIVATKQTVALPSHA